MATLKVFYGHSYKTNQQYWIASLNVEKQKREMNEYEFKSFLISKSEELYRGNLRKQTNVFYVHRDLELLICCNQFILEKEKINL